MFQEFWQTLYQRAVELVCICLSSFETGSAGIGFASFRLLKARDFKSTLVLGLKD